MSETQKVMTLLCSFRSEVTEHADALLTSKWEPDLRESVAAFLANKISTDSDSAELKLLVSLKIRAQQEIVGEQELLIIEQAADLAASMAKLARQSSELEHANLLSRQRQEFVAMLTHDLKNPLIGSNSILELFLSGKVGPIAKEQRDLLAQLKISNNESLHLIGVLGDVYRYEINPGDVHLEKCDLRAIVELSFNTMRTFSLQRDICATLIMPEVLPLIYLDPLAIQRLLDNLFSNALKFTAPKGNVELRITTPPGKIVLELKDDGEGIPPDEKEHLFERFSQGDAGKRYSAGSGLGLYLCKQIAEAHGGRIEHVDCEVGSLFRVTLNAQLTAVPGTSPAFDLPFAAAL